MAGFKVAYLIYGDDHGRIAERRARLRAVAERESGAEGVELFEGEASQPDNVAAALDAMTFHTGRRFLIVDGVERWKASELGPVVDALKVADAETITVAFFGREEGRYKVDDSLAKAIAGAGGVLVRETVLKGKDLPRWAIDRGKELGLALDLDAAKRLVASVDERQQRVLRELEKLALLHPDGAKLGVEEIEDACLAGPVSQVWAFADAFAAGNAKTAIRSLVALQAQGERLSSVLFAVMRRLRDAHTVAAALEAGEPVAQAKKKLRMPPFVADRVVALARKREADQFRQAIERLADLELASRGGGEAKFQEATNWIREIFVLAGDSSLA